MNLPCLLCDMAAEGRGWFGFQHDRSNWSTPGWRPAMAAAHGLVLAEGGTLTDGPWVPWEVDVPDDGEYLPTDGAPPPTRDWRWCQHGGFCH